MLTREERTLLENFIDATDRLYDGDTNAVDVYALLLATAAALKSGSLAEQFATSARELKEIVRSTATSGQKRDETLTKTDGLRVHVAQALRTDAKENPRQRHRI